MAMYTYWIALIRVADSENLLPIANLITENQRSGTCGYGYKQNTE